MKMKTFLTTAFAMMVVCASAVNVSVTKQTKRSIGNNESVVTDVVIEDLNFIDTNSYDHASTARVKFPSSKTVEIRAANPDYSGSEVDAPTNNIKGVFRVHLDDDAVANSKFDFSELSEGDVKYFGPDGKEYTADLILKAKTIDIKMNRRMPKMKQSVVDTLPAEAVELDASSTDFTVGKLVTEYNKLAQGFNLLREFVMSNAIADANYVTVEATASTNIVKESNPSYMTIGTSASVSDATMCTITLDPGEGTFAPGVESTVIKAVGSTLGTLPTPTRSGYTFVKWRVAILEADVSSDTVVDGDLDLEAVWVEEITPPGTTTYYYKFFKDSTITVTGTEPASYSSSEEGYDVYTSFKQVGGANWFDSGYYYPRVDSHGGDCFVTNGSYSATGTNSLEDAVVTTDELFATREDLTKRAVADNYYWIVVYDVRESGKLPTNVSKYPLYTKFSDVEGGINVTFDGDGFLDTDVRQVSGRRLIAIPKTVTSDVSCNVTPAQSNVKICILSYGSDDCDSVPTSDDTIYTSLPNTKSIDIPLSLLQTSTPSNPIYVHVGLVTDEGAGPSTYYARIQISGPTSGTVTGTSGTTFNSDTTYGNGGYLSCETAVINYTYTAPEGFKILAASGNTTLIGPNCKTVSGSVVGTGTLSDTATLVAIVVVSDDDSMPIDYDTFDDLL